ncbi:15737_t:CDS:2 [Cetraspora pellucida]|uniref:15737_t:CDS:1 n=1 Tax=Cetraspora pellucida TaxID=1433469 RepID=A0A9N9C526_9GLOM|nr:15737_t:CDS:2 [Cetraspora pellucida]
MKDSTLSPNDTVSNISTPSEIRLEIVVQTAEEISSVIMNILEKYFIKKKIFTLTMNNTTTNKSLLRLFENAMLVLSEEQSNSISEAKKIISYGTKYSTAVEAGKISEAIETVKINNIFADSFSFPRRRISNKQNYPNTIEAKLELYKIEPLEEI